jgi:hypothetical protein
VRRLQGGALSGCSQQAGEVGLEQIAGCDQLLQLAHLPAKRRKDRCASATAQGADAGLPFGYRWRPVGGRPEGRAPGWMRSIRWPNCSSRCGSGPAARAAGRHAQTPAADPPASPRAAPFRGGASGCRAPARPPPRSPASPASGRHRPASSASTALKGSPGPGSPGRPRHTTSAWGSMRQNTPAAQPGAIAVQPHQPRPLQLGQQGVEQPLGGAPGQGPAMAGAHGRSPPLARPARPAAIRASSRMRQLSQTPQGSVPPL